MSSVSVEALDAALRERGLRATPQRRQVLTAILDLGHATPEQIHEHVQAVNPAVNLSTVYRALELLESLALVSHTHLDHGAPTYHLAAHARHLHLVCRECGSVVEAELAIARPLAAVVIERYGFTADLTHLSVHGLCADCATTANDETGSHERAQGETQDREANGPAQRSPSHDTADGRPRHAH
jgi:Fur family transcriptional regulator, ferric uptake regulator